MTDTQAARPEYDVFFSYDRADADRAQRLADALRTNDLRVWIDSRNRMKRGRPLPGASPR
ncbi:MAG TPA: TIR domain-containing protein [Longimicrobium sp.]|nr:TIR domain-containing protein [Longimicrobium sp.]